MDAESGPPIKAMNIETLRGKKATVMGLGLFGGGSSVSRYLAKNGVHVLVTDLRAAELLSESIQALEDLPIAFRLGEHRESDFTQTDLVIANPAVRQDSEFLCAARNAGVPISSELDLFLDACPAPVVAVTGTNGKSTTTALIGDMLESSELFSRVWVGGNIGRSLLEFVHEISPKDIVVLEVSSFQLEALRARQNWPKVAVVLGITPDHLDRHGNFESYAEAKARILAFQGKDDHAVLHGIDPVVSGWANRCQGSVQRFGGLDPHLAVIEGWVQARQSKKWVPILPVEEVLLPGDFNLENVLAAVGCALALQVQPLQIRRAVRQFSGVEHRLELLGDKNGIRIFNNAVSTSPESTISALQALPKPIFLIAGGKGKNLDLMNLAEEIAKNAKECVLYGQAANALALEIEKKGFSQVVVVSNLAQALSYSLPRLKGGDHLLYSPAFSSYDQYRNFRERGEEFRSAISQWLGKETREIQTRPRYKSFSSTA